MSSKNIVIPGDAYCTAPEGTRLSYGDRVRVLYSKKGGRLFVTDKGVFQSVRFSSEAPSMEIFDRPKKYARKVFTVVKDSIVSYKELYESCKEDAKRAIRDGRTEEFCKQLINQ